VSSLHRAVRELHGRQGLVPPNGRSARRPRPLGEEDQELERKVSRCPYTRFNAKAARPALRAGGSRNTTCTCRTAQSSLRLCAQPVLRWMMLATAMRRWSFVTASGFGVGSNHKVVRSKRNRKGQLLRGRLIPFGRMCRAWSDEPASLPRLLPHPPSTSQAGTETTCTTDVVQSCCKRHHRARLQLPAKIEIPCWHRKC
jgi:hypothetical protein